LGLGIVLCSELILKNVICAEVFEFRGSFLDTAAIAVESHGGAVGPLFAFVPEMGNVVVHVNGKSNNVERRVDALEGELAGGSSLVMRHVVFGANFEPHVVNGEEDGLEVVATGAFGRGYGRVCSHEVVGGNSIHLEEHIDEVLEVESGDVDLARTRIQDRVDIACEQLR
jgi:hypothetical protein